jgi:hypothetical protein
LPAECPVFYVKRSAERNVAAPGDQNNQPSAPQLSATVIQKTS